MYKLLCKLQCSGYPFPLDGMVHGRVDTHQEVGRRFEGKQCGIEMEQGIKLDIPSVRERRDGGVEGRE